MEVSIFDLDKTLTKGSTSFTVARKLFFRNQLPSKSLLKYLKKYLLSLVANREMKSQDLHNFINDSLNAFKNYDQNKMQKDIENILLPLLRKNKLIYKKAIITLKEELANGRTLILATAAPKEIADIFAQHLGFSYVVSTNFEVKENQYTGALSAPFCHGEEKTKLVRKLLTDLNAAPENVKTFSDSFNDLSLLNLSSKPTAVNPDSSLRKHSKVNNWEIIDYQNFRLLRKVFYSSLSAIILYYSVSLAL